MCLRGKGNGGVWWDEGEERLGSDIVFLAMNFGEDGMNDRGNFREGLEDI